MRNATRIVFQDDKIRKLARLEAADLVLRMTGPGGITRHRTDSRFDADAFVRSEDRLGLLPQVPGDRNANLVQRPERRHRGIRVHHPVEPGILDRLATVEQLHFVRAEHLVAHHVSPVVDVIDQEAGYHAERCHALDLVIVQDRAVLDAAAQSMYVDPFVPGCFNRIEDAVDGRVAVTMQRQRPPSPATVDDHLP